MFSIIAYLYELENTVTVYSVLTDIPPHLGLLLQASSRLEEYLGNTDMAFLAGYGRGGEGRCWRGDWQVKTDFQLVCRAFHQLSFFATWTPWNGSTYSPSQWWPAKVTYLKQCLHSTNFLDSPAETIVNKITTTLSQHNMSTVEWHYPRCSHSSLGLFTAPILRVFYQQNQGTKTGS